MDVCVDRVLCMCKLGLMLAFYWHDYLISKKFTVQMKSLKMFQIDFEKIFRFRRESKILKEFA